MSGTPSIKVFDADGVYQCAFKEIEAAAAIMGFYGDGATIRFGHSKSDIVWTEGAETQSAMESYDHVAEVAEERRMKRQVAAMLRSGYSEADIKRILATA